LNSIVQNGKRFSRFQIPDINVIVFLERKLPLSVLIHLLEECGSNALDDMPTSISRSSSNATLLAVEPTFFFLRFDEKFSSLCISNKN
jgi:hypothetical protein